MAELSENALAGIRQAVHLIRSSRRIVVLTGAGISTSSGIPDFRSAGSGLWQRFDPLQVASLSSFRYNPDQFFEWIYPLAQVVQAAQPNPAHQGLARLEQAGFIRTVITQNIDGLHQRAGSKMVLEVHGSFRTLTCIHCYQKREAGSYLEAFLRDHQIPRCQECGGILKPDVVLFGEQLPVHTWLKAQEVSKRCDLMIIAGSSLEVMPVAGLPMQAVQQGAHLVLINQTATYIDVRADVVFKENVVDVIPRIADEVLGD